MPDFIPQGDGAFQTWAANFSTYLTANAVALGLVAGDATAVATKVTAFNSAMTALTTANAAQGAAMAAKNTTRHDLEALVRGDVKRIQATPAVTDAQRASLGITIKDTSHTPAPTPTAVPYLKLDSSLNLEHKISWVQFATSSKARPEGVLATQIWVSKPGATAAPAADSDWELLALDTASPYLAVWETADIGHRKWYRANYLSTSNLQGPFGAVVTALVTG